ncbi:6-cysteine protein [Plasmodium gaboni]|uniref:6-cysteine protein n=1 Tax=Plasmodium gaboni TaxID=647221 RepID=A0A151LWK3_9APIC|nr:6-cysteine protein [Plasmodium gaboni]KYO03522.1 6-cysteine protein [Plasmodium gaboni]
MNKKRIIFYFFSFFIFLVSVLYYDNIKSVLNRRTKKKKKKKICKTNFLGSEESEEIISSVRDGNERDKENYLFRFERLIKERKYICINKYKRNNKLKWVYKTTYNKTKKNICDDYNILFNCIKEMIYDRNKKNRFEYFWLNFFYINKYIFNLYYYMFDNTIKIKNKIHWLKEKINIISNNNITRSGNIFYVDKLFFFNNEKEDKDEYKDEKKKQSDIIKMNIKLHNNTRKLSVSEENVELKPYVKQGERNETVVNLYEYFTGGVKRSNNNNEIVITSTEQFHRIVIICFKPTVKHSHIITSPHDALNHIVEENDKIKLSEEIYAIPFYPVYGNLGLKNVITTGIVEFMIPYFSRAQMNFTVTCANGEIDNLYKFEDLIKIRIRIPRNTKKILGISTNEKDKTVFERIVDNTSDEYRFKSYNNKIVGVKLENSILDPPGCFKTVYEDNKIIQLEVFLQYVKCINLDRDNYKIRFFFLPEGFGDEEIEFSCKFTYKKKTSNIIFGLGETNVDKDIFYLEDEHVKLNIDQDVSGDKEFYSHLNYNGIPYNICNFEYKSEYDAQVCERTIHEFTLFIYNCNNVVGTQIQSTEPITTIKYLNATYPINKFSDITLLSKDIDIEGLEENFRNFKFFLTSYINHGPFPLIIECVISNSNNDHQNVYILLHLRTSIKNRTVSFCDFEKVNGYNYLNNYIDGDICNINITSNSVFGFKCPSNSIKEPKNCFSQVYIDKKVYKLNDKLSNKLILYSMKQEDLAIAGFNNYISNSFSFECYCVDKNQTYSSYQSTSGEDILNHILKRIHVNYKNYDELYDYNIHDKIIHEPIIIKKNTSITYICDFVNKEQVLQPLNHKTKNYICTIWYPTPLNYIALACPTNLRDEQNDQTISEVYNSLQKDILKPTGKEQEIDEKKKKLNILFSKRNIYSDLYHLPKDAPKRTINKNGLNIINIDEIIPGILIKDIININLEDTIKPDVLLTSKSSLQKRKYNTYKSYILSTINKSPHMLEKPSIIYYTPFSSTSYDRSPRSVSPLTKSSVEESQDYMNMYKQYIRKRNSIENGFFIFQLPPYLKKNQTIEFACINDSSIKNKNVGNNGIMTIHLKSFGNPIDGCYFYKNNAKYNYLKKSIKIDDPKKEECNIKSDGEIEFVGIMCPYENNLYLTPSKCFMNTYDNNDSLVEILDINKNFEYYSNDKGISYLKIPQEFFKHVHLFCYCNTDKDSEVNNNILKKKENKISLELNYSNKGFDIIKTIDYQFESDILIGYSYYFKRITPIYRKKHICDFTTEDNSLEPESYDKIIYSCYLSLEDNLSFVDVKCPKNKKISNSEWLFKYGTFDKSSELIEDDENIKKYENMKYMPEDKDEIIYLFKKQKLEDILPGVIIFDKNRYFFEKGNFSFVTPLIVKEDITIKLLCDNSETIIENKIGKKGIILIKIPQHITDKKFYGCDFSGDLNKKKKTSFYYSSIYDLKTQNQYCEIKLKENIIISLNCPNGNINPNNCFNNVFLKTNMNEQITEGIQNIFDQVKVINTKPHVLLNSSSTFLIISKITKKELNFFCTCHHHETKNIGTIYIKNEDIINFSKAYKESSILKYIDVTPYYLKDTYICDFTHNHYDISFDTSVNIQNILERYLKILSDFYNTHEEFTYFSIHLKLRKEIMKNKYIDYLKKIINEYKQKETSEKIKKLTLSTNDNINTIFVYRCNIDLGSFDKFKIKCPSKISEDTDKKQLFQNLIYSSNLGLNETDMLNGLNKLLYGSVLINKKEKNVSFFEKGELELIISPYADSSKNIIFSCENVPRNLLKGIIGSASIFIKKNDNKILGCDFIDTTTITSTHMETSTSYYGPYTSSSSHSSLSSSHDVLNDLNEHNDLHRMNHINTKKNSFEFEIELVEGKNTYCNIEAIENDIVGFSCPYNFLTTPSDCFESVQIEGVDKELETHKLEKLLKGVKILNNDIYKYNFTPSYIILPKKIKKSLKIFCKCNSVKLIKTGIIQINIIGDDLNNWFKKEITHNIFAYQKMNYFYDFSKGPINISSENVLGISTMSLMSSKKMEKNKKVIHKKGYKEIKRGDENGDENGNNNDHMSVITLSAPGEDDEDDEDDEDSLDEGDEEYDEGDSVDDVNDESDDDFDDEDNNILNPLRTKQVYDITIAASEFSKVQVVCPLRNSSEFRQSKISPENFFEYVYVLEDNNDNKRKRSKEQNEKLVTAILEGKKNIVDGSFTNIDDRYNKKSSKNASVEYDDMGNKIFISIKSEKPKAVIGDIISSNISPIHISNNIINTSSQSNIHNETINSDNITSEYEQYNSYLKDILVIKNINEVISYANIKIDINEQTYSSSLHIPPLILKDAEFLISCDNSLTLNESTRGKTATVKIKVKSNFLKIYGCDFVGDFSTHFLISNKWNDIPKNYICKINIQDDMLIGLACPSFTKLHPPDCFENVMVKQNVYKKNILMETKNIFFYKQNDKPILSFIHVKKILVETFLCKCYQATNTDYKEVTMQIFYEPYVMGTPKYTLEKSIIQYKYADLKPPLHI